MTKGRMWKNSKVLLAGLLVTTVLAVGGVGCQSQVSREPFIPEDVATVRIVMTEEDWTTCQKNADAEEYIKANFWYDDELVPDVAVRPKGNSSLRSAIRSESLRFSLKVDFNFFNSARTFRGLKKVNYNNGFSDPTLIRERLAYELFEQMGIPTPRTSFVDLWVNDTHLGVYTQVEQIDATFLQRHFADATGNLYKPEAAAASLAWTEAELESQRARLTTTEQGDSGSNLDVNLGGGRLSEIMRALGQQESANNEAVPPNIPGGMPPPGMPLPPDMLPPDMPAAGMPPGGMPQRQQGDYLEMMGLKTNENSPDHSALLHFLDVLNNEPDETFPAEIEKVLDVDEALRFLAVSALTVHLDNYLGMGHNYYLYEVDGYFTILPWDLNMAFGTFNCNIDRDGLINFYIDEPTCGPVAERPLVQRLLAHQPYLDAYHEYLEYLLDGPFSADVMESRIDELANLIRPFVETDELKFYSTADFERSFTEDMRNAEALPAIPPLSQKSLNCLKEQFSQDALKELRTRRPSSEELKKLRSCLTQEELTAFLQSGLAAAAIAPVQQPREPRAARAGGPSAIGLKTFVIERAASVRQQLDGERQSTGNGKGNGGTSGIPGARNRR